MRLQRRRAMHARTCLWNHTFGSRGRCRYRSLHSNMFLLTFWISQYFTYMEETIKVLGLSSQPGKFLVDTFPFHAFTSPQLHPPISLTIGISSEICACVVPVCWVQEASVGMAAASAARNVVAFRQGQGRYGMSKLLGSIAIFL